MNNKHNISLYPSLDIKCCIFYTQSPLYGIFLISVIYVLNTLLCKFEWQCQVLQSNAWLCNQRWWHHCSMATYCPYLADLKLGCCLGYLGDCWRVGESLALFPQLISWLELPYLALPEKWLLELLGSSFPIGYQSKEELLVSSMPLDLLALPEVLTWK